MIPLFSKLIGRVTPFALLKIFNQYDMLATSKVAPYYHSLRDSLGLPCHHVFRQRLGKKDILQLQDIHPHCHFVKPTGDVGPVSVGQLLLMNPRVIKGKGQPRGSRNRRSAASSTKRDPSAFEIATQEQRRVLRPRLELAGKDGAMERGRK